MDKGQNEILFHVPMNYHDVTQKKQPMRSVPPHSNPASFLQHGAPMVRGKFDLERRKL